MKLRQDAWSEENDLLLAETVLRHVREGSTQLNAFEEVGDKLNRTSAACGFRWNAVVRHRYEKALQLAKKQRKQRQRMLGKDQGGKKKLLYSPPVPTMEEVEMAIEPVNDLLFEDTLEASYSEVPEPETKTVQPAMAYAGVADDAPMSMDKVIAYLESLNHSSIKLDILKNENERLKRENADIKRKNSELESKIGKLEQNSVTIQEDYETLMNIMNRARKLAILDDEERPATKFKMDRNGNLEKVAE
ncbi:prespore-specific regulator [Cytobacillus horneckiae]|uniref:RsfA family transcriptional regulator n=1 Tax=Cytobacillus horneckiae TaxID=549687 RepID=A0A2N0ZG16_9BACI|nr:RsfA family transcriptional regulator [Cytobacillus horneckiae]MBN6884994.1 RsfA family transcriptional regulator [Cytobacillus horneckiae]MCM3179259.1 RsfA family transcriptional regulator [Cytobacillus horneckiae]MEC1154481.1 RsfA family transcriptional regulator [Cytobacillus horneckiae]MED2937816.1 RsfA family transcriptional regulator [Cytobacillus horneckiae]PKG28461.1 RsfA family transcriptional regulator [Cytobacillus horneckiae]